MRAIDEMCFSFCILCILFSTTPVFSGSLSKAPPILWTKSNASLHSGEETALLVIKYETPCSIFYDKDLVPGTKEDFIKQCEEDVKTSIIDPLDNVCNPK